MKISHFTELYVTEKEFIELVIAKQTTGRMLGAMLQNPSPFLLK